MDDSILSEIIPLAGIFMIICIVVIPIWVRSHYASRDRARLHETVRLMVEKGQPVSSEMLQSLSVAQNNGGTPRLENGRGSDMRRGVTLVMVGLALVTLGLALYFLVGSGVSGAVAGAGAFPGFIGLGFIIMALISPSKKDVRDV